jgi:hypothetical protein
MTDAELFLLGWAVLATVLYFREKDKADTNRIILMHFIKDAKAREQIVGAWEDFKKARGVE